jgi:hypothetical protein
MHVVRQDKAHEIHVNSVMVQSQDDGGGWLRRRDRSVANGCPRQGPDAVTQPCRRVRQTELAGELIGDELACSAPAAGVPHLAAVDEAAVAEAAVAGIGAPVAATNSA